MKRTYTAEQKETKRLWKIEYKKINAEKIKQKDKEYREANKDVKKEYGKKYYETNKKILLEKQKKYVEINKDKTKSVKKEYRKNNKVKIKEYFITNKDTLNAKRKIYVEANREKIREYGRKHQKFNMVNNPLYKLTAYIRTMTLKAIKNNGYSKKSKTFELIGISKEEFYKHIEQQFESWMTWNNRGNWNGIPTEINISWDIDHITPLASAKTEEELLKLCHYTNLRPFCSYTNRNIKKDKLNF